MWNLRNKLMKTIIMEYLRMFKYMKWYKNIEKTPENKSWDRYKY